MTWAAERTFGYKVVRRRPSPYLDDLGPLLDALAAGSAPADAARELSAVRQTARAARGTPDAAEPLGYAPTSTRRPSSVR